MKAEPSLYLLNKGSPFSSKTLRTFSRFATLRTTSSVKSDTVRFRSSLAFGWAGQNPSEKKAMMLEKILTGWEVLSV
uniref:Uncharacterized protein MANES_01G212200 n=1 Tax=Rhizophora mucronata TaxID=61149 RepID=A0A2P2QNH2_RHIMU